MTDWGICSGSQIRAQAKYDSENTTRVSMKLNFRTDNDVIQWLWKQKSMQGAIKQLIRDEISRTQSEDK
jgi:hypothetical protein